MFIDKEKQLMPLSVKTLFGAIVIDCILFVFLESNMIAVLVAISFLLLGYFILKGSNIAFNIYFVRNVLCFVWFLIFYFPWYKLLWIYSFNDEYNLGVLQYIIRALVTFPIEEGRLPILEFSTSHLGDLSHNVLNFLLLPGLTFYIWFKHRILF